jgi:membrane-associated phospholipid phosphatase
MNSKFESSNLKLSTWTKRGFFAFAIFGIAIMKPCVLYWDNAWSQQRTSIHIPGDLAKALQLAEVFAHGSGIIAILGTLFWLDIPRRKMLVHPVLTSLTAGAIANGLKFVFTRIRPHADTNMTALDNWMPLFSGRFLDATHRSFPSGHSATAVGLAIGLSLVYPRGKYLFALFALLACLQRLVSASHFPSDVLAGIVIALCSCLVIDRFIAKPAA